MRRPSPRLICPACSGAPRLPRDLRQEVRCGCGARLRVALVPVRAVAKPARVPPLPEPSGQSSVAAMLDKVTLARPVPVFRNVGSERERQWGAATDTPVAPGDRLLIVAKNGSTVEWDRGRDRRHRGEWPPGHFGRRPVATGCGEDDATVRAGRIEAGPGPGVGCAAEARRSRRTCRASLKPGRRSYDAGPQCVR